MKIDSPVSRAPKLSFFAVVLSVVALAWLTLGAAGSPDAAASGSGGVASGGGLNLTESVSKPKLAPRRSNRRIRRLF